MSRIRSSGFGRRAAPSISGARSAGNVGQYRQMAHQIEHFLQVAEQLETTIASEKGRKARNSLESEQCGLIQQLTTLVNSLTTNDPLEDRSQEAKRIIQSLVSIPNDDSMISARELHEFLKYCRKSAGDSTEQPLGQFDIVTRLVEAKAAVASLLDHDFDEVNRRKMARINWRLKTYRAAEAAGRLVLAMVNEGRPARLLQIYDNKSLVTVHEFVDDMGIFDPNAHWEETISEYHYWVYFTMALIREDEFFDGWNSLYCDLPPKAFVMLYYHAATPHASQAGLEDPLDFHLDSALFAEVSNRAMGLLQDWWANDSVILTKNEINVLAALGSSSIPLLQEEIASAVDISRRTLGPLLGKLRKKGLSERPRGSRSGDIITQAGRDALYECKKI